MASILSDAFMRPSRLLSTSGDLCYTAAVIFDWKSIDIESWRSPRLLTMVDSIPKVASSTLSSAAEEDVGIDISVNSVISRSNRS